MFRQSEMSADCQCFFIFFLLSFLFLSFSFCGIGDAFRAAFPVSFFVEPAAGKLLLFFLPKLLQLAIFCDILYIVECFILRWESGLTKPTLNLCRGYTALPRIYGGKSRRPRPCFGEKGRPAFLRAMDIVYGKRLKECGLGCARSARAGDNRARIPAVGS